VPDSFGSISAAQVNRKAQLKKLALASHRMERRLCTEVIWRFSCKQVGWVNLFGGPQMELAALIAVLVIAGSMIPGNSEVLFYR